MWYKWFYGVYAVLKSETLSLLWAKIYNKVRDTQNFLSLEGEKSLVGKFVPKVNAGKADNFCGAVVGQEGHIRVPKKKKKSKSTAHRRLSDFCAVMASRLGG